ncbi:MAG: tetratricopeptide repeat protein [Polyangiaceae bacterium]|nr:tetratricopeptide repeat protein [Polyangiaceae bacterium]
MFQAGWVSFNEGDYARAITYWEDAFRRDCTALALLLNLARAYELAGMLQQAVVALQTYLERMPESPERDSIQRRIEVLREKIAETQPSEPVPVEPIPAQPKVDLEPARPEPAPPPPPEPRAGRSIVPLFVSGVGAIALIGGGAVYLDARHALSDYSDQCDARGSRLCPDDATRDEANRARTRVQVSSVVSLAGAAATVGGLVWYFVGPEPKQIGAHGVRGRVALEPHVSPGFAGVVVLGAY